MSQKVQSAKDNVSGKNSGIVAEVNGVIATHKIVDRKAMRDASALELASQLPSVRDGAKGAIKGEPTHDENGNITVYGLLLAFQASVPPATSEQARYKQATLTVWNNREQSKMDNDENYTPTMDIEIGNYGPNYIFNEDNPPASIAEVSTDSPVTEKHKQSARSQAYNRRHRAAKLNLIDAPEARAKLANRIAMAEACYLAACNIYGADSVYAKSAFQAGLQVVPS